MDHIELTATPLELQTQGSPFQVHHLGNFIGIPGTSFPVWHSKKAIANILAIPNMAKHCQITMDTSINPTISVPSPSGIILPFRQTDMGLFTYHSDSHPNPLDPTGSSYLCQQTIANQWKLYTPQQLEQVDKACTLHQLLGWPSDSTLEHCLSHGHILNTNITPEDVHHAHTIYSPNIAYLKGHTPDKHMMPHILVPQVTTITPHILQHHGNVVLSVDFFYVQGIPFLHAMSCTLSFHHTQVAPDCTKGTIITFLLTIVQQYHSHGLNVAAIHADCEFDCSCDNLAPIQLHIVN